VYIARTGAIGITCTVSREAVGKHEVSEAFEEIQKAQSEREGPSVDK